MFSPTLPAVQVCLAAQKLREAGDAAAAEALLASTLLDTRDKFERFLLTFELSQTYTDPANILDALEFSLQYAKEIDTVATQSAYPRLYEEIANVARNLGDTERVQTYERLSALASMPKDPGPFYHGTRAQLNVGDRLTPGGVSNYQDGLVMNHIYFTALIDGAALAASLAKGEAPERIYIVEPTGEFEPDPNVTNVRFPGNLTQSYRSSSSLIITGEVSEYAQLTPDERARWRREVEAGQGEIIN